MLSACVSTPVSYRAQPLELTETTIEYSRGVPITKSRLGDGAVAVGFSPHTDDGRIIMLVSVRNNSAKSENFGSEKLELVDSSNRPLRVWNADDLVVETSSTASGQKTMLVVGAVLGAASAIASSYSATTGSYSTPYGGGTFQSTTSDPSIALAGTAAATAGAASGMSAIDRGRDDRIATIRRVYLQTNTVAPGQQYNGLVVANAPSGSYPQNLTLSVKWLGQVHKLQWTLSRIGSEGGGHS